MPPKRSKGESRVIIALGLRQIDDVAVRIGENGRQHQRNGAGFSRAGRAEYGEILCQQFVDQHKGRSGSIMVEASNADIGGRGPGIDRRQIGFGRSSNGSARNGMTGDAAMEPSWPLRQWDDLSQQVDRQNDACGRPVTVHLCRADRPHHLAIRASHLEHRADADGSLGKLIGRDDRPHLRTGLRHDTTEYVVHSASSSVCENFFGSVYRPVLKKSVISAPMRDAQVLTGWWLLPRSGRNVTCCEVRVGRSVTEMQAARFPLSPVVANWNYTRAIADSSVEPKFGQPAALLAWNNFSSLNRRGG
jgi:hypothetical protein